MASVASHQVKAFVSPFPGPAPVSANDVRGNDNILRTQFNAHDADSSIHIQSGTLANRPATLPAGSTYFCTDTQDTYTSTGAGWVQSAWAHWYGDFYDTTDQVAAAANTEQLVTLNGTGVTRGVSLVSSSRVTVAYAGHYNVQFSAQVTNSAADEQDAWFWWKKNGTNIAESAGQITVHKKHGTTNGNLLACWNINLTLAANDYLQLYWQASTTSMALDTIPAAGSIPRSPSVIITINRI
jgi:hypothetical protein